MKCTLKTLIQLVAVFAATGIYGSCGDNKTSSGSLPSSDRDTLYQYPYIVQHFKEDPTLALAYVDTAEMKGIYGRDTIQWMRSFIYAGMNDWEQQVRHLQDVVNSPSFDGSDRFYVKQVLNLADAYTQINRTDESLRSYMYADSLAVAHGMKSYQAEADYNIGLIQCNVGNFDLGLEMMRKAIDCYEEAAKENERLILEIAFSYGNYANRLISAERYDEAVEACQQRVKYIDKLKVVYAGKMPLGYADELYGYSYAYMASAYVGSGKKEEARKALQQLLQTDFSHTQPASQFLSFIYNGLGESQKAIEYIKQDIAANEADTFRLPNLYYLLADAHGGIHDYQSQVEDLKQYIEYVEYTKKAEQSQKVLELVEQYKTREKEYELTISQGREKQARITSIAACIILALTLIALFVILKSYRDIRKKNRSLVANINELLDARRKELAMMKPVAAPVVGEDGLKDSVNSKNGEVETEAEAATRRVQYYIYQLTSRHLFCAADFDREALLDELHLQKVGFWKSFTEETGQNFAQYLLNLRLEYAADQIRQHPEYTVDAIAAESGFSSRATFYRNFSTRFGITPTLYREQSAKPLE